MQYNNSNQTDRYLQNEMSAEERAAFEALLLTDAGLREEFQIQRSIAAAAYDAGVKTTFAKAMRTKAMTGKIVKWSFAVAAVAVIVLIINSNIFTGSTKTILQAQKDIAAAFINPPLKAIDVPFTEYYFEAEKADTFYALTGSVVCFPANALKDASGNIVKGKVDVRFREFRDPLDFFVSGIQMSYDSAGLQYDFKSSGMCEINVSQNGKELFVNTDAKPEIFLSATDKSPQQNLYVLDTVARKWTYMGKDRITEVRNLKSVVKTVAGQAPVAINEMPEKPLPPAKADIGHPSFSIEIEPGSFQELFTYDGLKFEVLDENAYLASDAQENWYDVKLDRTAKEGIYTVTFSNQKRKVSYKVKPVLEEKDYDAALKVFNEKTKTYENALQSRVRNEKNLSDSIVLLNKKQQERWNAENAAIIRMNALITARNKMLREEYERRVEDAKKQAANNLINQATFMQQIAQTAKSNIRFNTDFEQSNEIIRSFQVNRFGVWNCDQPVYQQSIPMIAEFRDDRDSLLIFATATVVYRRFNGIMQFPGAIKIRVMPGEENMIWAVQDSSFYYYSYKDFKGARINDTTKAFTFKMRRAKEEISSYAQVRALVEGL